MKKFNQDFNNYLILQYINLAREIAKVNMSCIRNVYDYRVKKRSYEVINYIIEFIDKDDNYYKQPKQQQKYPQQDQGFTVKVVSCLHYRIEAGSGMITYNDFLEHPGEFNL